MFHSSNPGIFKHTSSRAHQQSKGTKTMKLPANNNLLIRSALILALAVCSPVQAQPPEGRGMMKGKMMGYCREMIEHRQQMNEAFKTQNAALTEQLAKLKSAPDDKKMEQMTALVTLIAEQQIAMNAHRENMHDLMTKHMLRHVELGQKSMEDCPILKMKDTDDKKDDTDTKRPSE